MQDWPNEKSPGLTAFTPQSNCTLRPPRGFTGCVEVTFTIFDLVIVRGVSQFGQKILQH